MNILFNGFNVKVLTVETSDANLIGYPVTLNSSGQTAKSGENAVFLGFCVSERGGCSGVQLEGYYETTYSGTAPTCGFQRLVSNGSNGVKVSTATDVPLYKVLKVDTENKKIGFIL